MPRPWWQRLLGRDEAQDGDATHVSTRWRTEAARVELRAGWEGARNWRTPKGEGSLWDIARDEQALAGGRG